MSRALLEIDRPETCRGIVQALGGKFSIIEPLENTGIAQYFLAQVDRVDGQSAGGVGDIVRLKVLAEKSCNDPAEVELFQFEARAASRLMHRNVLRTSVAHQLGRFHFCVLEHRCDAETLRCLLNREGWQDIDRAIDVTYQSALALEHARGNGILHLNLQPENILIDADGRVIVSAFGIEADSGLRPAQLRRSERQIPHYMSPEQVVGRQVGCYSDLYSLGAVLFEMLTDRTPFDGPDAETIRHKQGFKQPPPPELFRPGVPNALSAVVTKLLEKDVEKRFQTGAELLSALDELMNSRSPVEIMGLSPIEEEIEKVLASDEPLAFDDPLVEQPLETTVAWDLSPVVLNNDLAAQSLQGEMALADNGDRQIAAGPKKYREFLSSVRRALGSVFVAETAGAQRRLRPGRCLLIVAITAIVSMIQLAGGAYLPKVFDQSISGVLPAIHPKESLTKTQLDALSGSRQPAGGALSPDGKQVENPVSGGQAVTDRKSRPRRYWGTRSSGTRKRWSYRKSRSQRRGLNYYRSRRN